MMPRPARQLGRQPYRRTSHPVAPARDAVPEVLRVRRLAQALDLAMGLDARVGRAPVVGGGVAEDLADLADSAAWSKPVRCSSP